MSFILQKSDLVLEIGSGGAPLKRSDVLVDRFIIDDSGQRGGVEIYVDRRPLFVAAGEHLPFIDNSFDFVYCKHVIEHADDISAFLNEMSRVGKGGYIECPNPALETVHDVPQHNWYISNKKGKLLIHPKTPDNNTAPLFDNFIFHMLSDHFIIRNYWDLFTVQLVWSGRIEFEIFQRLEPVIFEQISEKELMDIIKQQRLRVLGQSIKDSIKENLLEIRNCLKACLEQNSAGQTLLELVRQRRRTKVRPRISLAELEPLLCCPYCKGKMAKAPTVYQCMQCGREYLIKEGVPIFL